jgi:copper(I)-binding protein
MSRTWFSRRGPVAVVLLVAAVTFGCSSSSSDTSTTATGNPSGIEVTDVWSRPTAPSATTGVVYLTLTSPKGDELLGAEVPPSVADSVELHETVTGTSSTAMGMTDTTMGMPGATSASNAGGMPDDTMMGSGAMSMREIPSLELPPGQAVRLEPGGYHLMLVRLRGPLVDGSSFQMTLQFRTAAPQTITVPVQNG